MRAVALVGALALAAGLAACVPSYVRQNDSPVLFRIAAINGGNVLVSDVGDLTSDTVAVTVAVRPKNPLNDNVPQIAEAVFVEQYRVRFFRTDGRDQEGVDVPFSFTGGLTVAVDIGTGADANVTVNIPLVRAQAKQEPPLRTFQNLLTTDTTRTGTQVVPPRITMTAEITIFGRTVAGEAVSDTGRVTVDFVD